jgi:putative transposase
MWRRKEKMEEKKHKWVIKRYLAGMPAKSIAAHLQISIRTVYRTIHNYKKFGKGLDIKSRGRPNTEINCNCKERVKEYWNKFQCGSVKLHKIMKRKGYGLSQYKIQQSLDEFKLTAPCPKRRGQRKYCSYRWPAGFMVLHTDWTTCPITGKQLIAYIDDHSRFIVGYGQYDGATTENTLKSLYRVLFEYEMPYAIITDRGSHFYANKIGKKKKGKCKFQEVLEDLGIKHIVSRAHHPQTNGKIERWFGTYKREFNERFKAVDEYVRFYNYERPHQRLGFKTPAEVFFKKEGVTYFQISRYLRREK